MSEEVTIDENDMLGGMDAVGDKYLAEDNIKLELDQDQTTSKNKQYDGEEIRRTSIDESIPVADKTLNIINEDGDDFDSFNGTDGAGEDEDADSDFGSFDDASFTELEEQEMNSTDNHNKMTSGGYARFSEDVFSNQTQFDKNLHEALDNVFPNINQKQDENNSNSLLTERSSEIFEELSKIPHLKPSNWIKLNVRHNLLIKLGVPINLDEIKEENLLQTPKVQRRKSVNEDDIKWDGFDLPDFEDLSISTDTKMDLLHKTTEILSAIETDNLNNSSHRYLETSNSTSLQEKLQQYKDNYKHLIELSSIWNKQLDDQKQNYEVYESVIQNLIGYSQKLKREEILANLKKIKLKGKSFWK